MKKILRIGLLLVMLAFQVSFASVPMPPDPVVKIKTSYGDIRVQLFPKETPKTVENFLGLVKQKKYDRNIFHRVIKHFMLQGGDYENHNGTGGQSIWGKPFNDEIVKALTHERGVLSMANAGAHTNGSQFFITQKASHHLNGKHTVFGKVIEGMTVVDAIAEVETDWGNRPLRAVHMTIVLEGAEEPPLFADQSEIHHGPRRGFEVSSSRGLSVAMKTEPSRRIVPSIARNSLRL